MVKAYGLGFLGFRSSGFGGLGFIGFRSFAVQGQGLEMMVFSKGHPYPQGGSGYPIFRYLGFGS